MLRTDFASTDAYIAATEQRPAASAPLPAVALTDPVGFARAFERFYDDHLPLRSLLVQANAWVEVFWLHTSSSPQVVIGRDNMLFIDKEIDYYRNDTPMDD